MSLGLALGTSFGSRVPSFGPELITPASKRDGTDVSGWSSFGGTPSDNYNAFAYSDNPCFKFDCNANNSGFIWVESIAVEAGETYNFRFNSVETTGSPQWIAFDVTNAADIGVAAPYSTPSFVDANIIIPATCTSINVFTEYGGLLNTEYLVFDNVSLRRVL